jgi:hypothetical protein
MSARGADPFGARQRTDLAWSRSGLAIAAVVVIVLRRLPQTSGGSPTVVLTLLACGLAAWSIGLWLARRVRREDPTPWPTSGPRTMRLLSIGVTLVASAAFVLALRPAP